MKLNLQDTFSNKLPADPDKNNTRRQVYESCFSYVTPKKPSNPKLLHASGDIAKSLGLTEEDLRSEDFLRMATGAEVLKGTDPYAMCYGGHQFGQWAGQLGDGRAINLTEIEHDGKRWVLQLKGAGETPYSRTADGFAVLRSSIREHLISEAMHYLGVPTTRSLSLTLSGDQVLRDVLYDGNPNYEKGAIVCRVSPCFIRFGNFEIFTSRGDFKTLQLLTDYTINEFYPKIKAGTKDGYISFFNEVVNNTLQMIVHWQRVGFVHGVMNTDNMSIHGLTIDYGPYGWLEGYDPDWTPNTTDSQVRRYRFGNQPHISLWNLYQLANALLPLIKDEKPLLDILNSYDANYQEAYISMMGQKLGLRKVLDKDAQLIHDLERILQLTETDMTIFFRNLAGVSRSMELKDSHRFVDVVRDAFYKSEELKDSILDEWNTWFLKYIDRLKREDISDEDRKSHMNEINPKYVLRNYMAQLIIEAADNDDYSLIDEVHNMLKRPYDEQEDYQKWFAKRPEWARNKVGSSVLSCSS